MSKDDIITYQSEGIITEKRFIRKKHIIVLTIVIVIFLLAILIPYIVTQDFGTLIISAVFFGFLDLMFLPILIITYKQKLIISKEKIIFYYKTFSRHKEYKKFNVRGLIIKFNNISYIKFRTQYGNGLVSADSTFVVFHLKNGKSFETTFFHFGKKQEAEILNVLKSINDKN